MFKHRLGNVCVRTCVERERERERERAIINYILASELKVLNKVLFPEEFSNAIYTFSCHYILPRDYKSFLLIR